MTVPTTIHVEDLLAIAAAFYWKLILVWFVLATWGSLPDRRPWPFHRSRT